MYVVYKDKSTSWSVVMWEAGGAVLNAVVGATGAKVTWDKSNKVIFSEPSLRLHFKDVLTC